MPKKTVKSRSDSAVQGTNDSSIVSKCSMSELGYFEDSYVQHFVCKCCRRAPIINRGYYIRAVAVNHAVTAFLESHKEKPNQNFSAVTSPPAYGHNQVLSLGAGFDAAYFRLKSQNYLKNSTYVEVDFSEVLSRKLALIRQTKELSDLLDAEVTSPQTAGEQIVLNTTGLKLIGADLTQLPLLTKSLNLINIDLDVPTLLLSEVVLTYLTPQSCTDVIQWAATHFRNATFVSYEQVLPNDAFGIFMCQHFRTIGSPLRNIDSYGTIQSHVDRYRKLGWNKCIAAADMNYFYHSVVSDSEHRRIATIEPFDEFEEWQLKCAHYILLTAFRGTCDDIAGTIWPVLSENDGIRRSRGRKYGQFVCIQSHFGLADDTAVQNGDALATLPQQQASLALSAVGCQRYGHTASVLFVNGRRHVAVIGGFGVSLGSGCHGRVSEVGVLNINDGNIVQTTAVMAGDVSCSLLSRMHHSANVIGDTRVLIVGGRNSPQSPSGDLVVALDVEPAESNVQAVCRTVDTSGCIPQPLWRHSATAFTVQGRTKLLVFGGRTLSSFCTDDCYLLDCVSFSWQKVCESDVRPEPRHSHTAELWKESKVFVACGLGDDEEVLSSVWSFNIASDCWQPYDVTPPIMARYSHSSAISKDRLVLLGGVSATGSCPDIEVINLASQHSCRISLPCPQADKLLMLHNHASVILEDSSEECVRMLVVGGGGNCFSFGTHLNNSLATVSFCLL